MPFSFSLRGHNSTNFLEEKLCLQPAEKIRGNMSCTQAASAIIARVGGRSWLRTQKHLLKKHSKQTAYTIFRETQPQRQVPNNCVLKAICHPKMVKLSIMSQQTYMAFFLLLNIKIDILKNVHAAQTTNRD